MARYPEARWVDGNDCGHYSGGPYRIVWHTTEGSSIAGAVGAYTANNSWPHFTVDEDEVVQHIDTELAARSLENLAHGVETNTNSAVQIELVSFARNPKSPALLARAARLARWLEAEHRIPREWPSGFPKPATPEGKDPGGHNRDRTTWITKGGHYGHCHVPENVHWDPGTIDVDALMAGAGAPASMKEDDMAYPTQCRQTSPAHKFVIVGSRAVPMGSPQQVARCADRGLVKADALGNPVHADPLPDEEFDFLFDVVSERVDP